MDDNKVISKQKTSPRAVDIQNEIKKRDEIIIRLSERLKESVKYRDEQISQIEDLKLELEKLQQEFHQAEEKLKIQEGHQNGSVETIEFVKGNLLDLQSSLKNVCVDLKPVLEPVLENSSHLENIPQCSAISSTETPCELEVFNTENLQDRKTDNESTCSLPIGRADVEISKTEVGKILFRPDMTKSDLEILCTQLKQKLEHIEEEHAKELRSRDLEFENRLEDKDDKLDIQELEFKRTLEVTNSEKTDLEFICSQLTKEIDSLKEKNSHVETIENDNKMYLETLKSEKLDLEELCSDLQEQIQNLDATHNEELCNKDSEFDNRLKEFKVTLESEYEELLETTENEKNDFELVCSVLRKEIHELTEKDSQESLDQNQQTSGSDLIDYKALCSELEQKLSDIEQESADILENRDVEYEMKICELKQNLEITTKEKCGLETLCSQLQEKCNTFDNGNSDFDKEKLETVTSENTPLHSQLKLKIADFKTENCDLSEKIKTLTGEKCDLETLCSQFEKDLADLKTQNCDLPKNLDTLTNEKAALETTCLELEQKLSILETQNIEIQTQNQELQKHFETALSERDSSDTTCTELQQRFSDIETQHNELQLKFQSAVSEKDVLETSCFELKQKLTDLEAEDCSILNSIKAELETKISDLQQTLENFQSEKTVLEENCVALELKLTERDTEFKTEQNLELDDVDSASLKQSELESRIEDFGQKLETANSKNSSLESLCSELQEKFEKSETQISEIQSEKYEFEDLCTILQQDLKELKTLNSECLDSKVAELAEKEKECSELKNKMADIERSYSDLLKSKDAELEGLYSEKLNMETQLSELAEKEKECSELKHKMADVESSYSELLKSKDAELEALNSERLDMESQLSELAERGKECSELKHKMADVESSYSELLKSKDAELEALNSEKLEIESQCSELKDQLVKVEEEFKAQMEESKQMQDSEIKEQLELANQEKASMKELCAQLEKELKALEETQKSDVQLRKDLEEHKQEIVELSERNVDLEENCSELTKQLEELETNHLATLKFKEDELSKSLAVVQLEKSKCTELSKQLEELEASHVAMEDLQAEKTSLETKYTELSKQLEELEASHGDELKPTENEFIQSLEETQKTKTRLETKCSELSKQLEELEASHFEELKSKESESSQLLEELQKEKTSFETKCSELSQQLEELEAGHMEELKSKDNEHNTSFEETQSEKVALETKCTELSLKLEESKSDHNEVLESQKLKFEKEISELKMTMEQLSSDKTDLESSCADLKLKLTDLGEKHSENDSAVTEKLEIEKLNSELKQEMLHLENKHSEEMKLKEDELELQKLNLNQRLEVLESEKEIAEGSYRELKLKLPSLDAEDSTKMESNAATVDEEQLLKAESEFQNILEASRIEKAELQQKCTSLENQLYKMKEDHAADLKILEWNLKKELSAPQNNFISEGDDQDLATTCLQLKQQIENLEEKHIKDLRTQEVELTFNFDQEIAEHKKDQELRFKRFVEATTLEKQQEFIKALQKMRKQYKRQNVSCSSVPNGDVPMSPLINSKDEIKTVEKLSQENKELAEIRDILLKQMDLSQVKVNKVLVKNELKSVGKSVSLENISLERTENDLFMEEIARISKVSTGDMNMEWELGISPMESCTDFSQTPGTLEGFFENDDGPAQNVTSASTNGSNEMTNIPCMQKDCALIRERYEELHACLSNNSPYPDSGIGDTRVKDKHSDFSEFALEDVTDAKVSHDLMTELKLLKQTNKDLEEKIDYQLDIFAEERSNFQKICEAMKVQVENLLLAKSHLELELESKNIAILTLSEEFHNSLGQFEAVQDDSDRFIEDEKQEINHLPEHYTPSNDDSGSFVREDDCSSLDLVEAQPHSDGDIEFWDTNFSNRYKTRSFPKQGLQVYEVDPELQLQGHSPTEHIQYISELEEKEKIIDDLILQVNSLERQLKSSKQFITEQSGERELERDESVKEIQRLRELVDEKDSQLKSHKNLYQEIGDMKERIESQQEEMDNLNHNNSDLKQQLATLSRKNTDLENHVKVLENELDDKDYSNDLESGSLDRQARESSSESTINDNIYESSTDLNNMVPLKKFKSDSEISIHPNFATELKMKQLEDEVLSVQYKLRHEKCVSRDLLNSLVAEQKRYNALLNKEATDNTSCNAELLDQWLTVSRLQNSLMEEQNYCSNILDALEDVQGKMGRMKTRLKDVEDEKCYLEEKLSESRLQQYLIPPDSKHQMSKLKRLYARYLRAESYRKALIYQKRYLLILIGGYQDTEETTLAMIAKMSCPLSPYQQSRYPYYSPALHVFRRTVTAIIAIYRMKCMVKKWQRAVKVGSPIVCGTSHLNNGYLSSQSS